VLCRLEFSPKGIPGEGGHPLAAQMTISNELSLHIGVGAYAAFGDEVVDVFFEDRQGDGAGGEDRIMERSEVELGA
jgi:hypothetical protein